MCASVVQSGDAVVLYDVPWETYKQMLDALPNQQFRHVYDRGTLELDSPLIYNVPWESYEKILDAFGDRRFRHTYQRGTLEIMSPSNVHERIKRFLGRLIEMATLECRYAMRSEGSTTQRDSGVEHGLEPDESYYIGDRPKQSEKGKHAKNIPPNLVVEVDIRSPKQSRLESYALLGVREVWRYRKGKIEFFGLAQNGAEYHPLEFSRAFPMIASKDVAGFVKQFDDVEENALILDFVAWLRKRLHKN